MPVDSPTSPDPPPNKCPACGKHLRVWTLTYERRGLIRVRRCRNDQCPRKGRGYRTLESIESREA